MPLAMCLEHQVNSTSVTGCAQVLNIIACYLLPLPYLDNQNFHGGQAFQTVRKKANVEAAYDKKRSSGLNYCLIFIPLPTYNSRW